MFVTWEAGDVDGRKVAIAAASAGYRSGDGAVNRSKAAATTYRNIDGNNVSVRDGYNRADYDYFRPGESIPTGDKDIQACCMQAYKKFSVVRNVVDMMSDFVVKGMDVVHPSPRIQKLGREWTKKVKMRAVSGRISRMLLRAAASPIRRKTERLSDTTMDALRTVGAGDAAKKSPFPAGEIPMGYTVLNPVSVEAIGGELVPFIGEEAVRYAVKVPAHIVRKLKNPKTDDDRALVKMLPSNILKAATSGTHLIPLPPNKTTVLHYKKDDHQVWATPLLYSLLDDLQMLEKLRLADRSALDGAISHIRLWRLGDLKERIFPTPEAIQRLADMLLHHVGGGVMDLIWGPELDLVETSTEIHRFLGNEKYITTLASIFQGLGVPPTLTGTGDGAGLTNNFVSLRVLMERLEYCREVLTEFWLGELAVVQAVFGFRQPFKLKYDIPSLSDDSAEKKLIIDLLDRDIFSPEFVQERFGGDPEIEAARIRRYTRARKEGSLPPKAGPFHIDSQQKAHLERQFAGNGEYTPSEFGIETKPRKPGEVPAAERMAKRKRAELATKQPPAGEGGRPKGANDSTRRKPKRVSPKQAARAAIAQAVLWANSAQVRIDELSRAAFLRSVGKDSMRTVAAKDASRYERLKFNVLCGLELGTNITPEVVKAALKKCPPLPEAINQLYRATLAKFVEERGTEPSVEQARQLQAMTYALYNFEMSEDSV